MSAQLVALAVVVGLIVIYGRLEGRPKRIFAWSLAGTWIAISLGFLALVTLG